MPNDESSMIVCSPEGEVRISCKSVSNFNLPFEVEKREAGVLLHHDFLAPEEIFADGPIGN
jgi:hypothetical protein